ncbi:MAG: hypothetical protein ACR2FH_03660 [Caulobacteraceae bacterium]
MGKSPPSPPPVRERRRLSWLTVGEVAGVLAVAIAALSYWDAHRQHVESESQMRSQARAEAAFVVVGAADAKGSEIALRALASSQAIQSQRYVFPTEVLAVSVDGFARPRIEAAWIADGLGRALDRAHAKADGYGRLPVGILSTYVEGGETRADRSEYAIGYSWRSRFLLGRQIALQGISLVHRGLAGDARAAIDRRWARDRPSGARASGPPETGR